VTGVRRVPVLVAALAVLAALTAAAYAVCHRPDRVLALGPVRPVAAPQAGPRAAARPAGSSADAGGVPQVAPAWVTTYAARTGIPARALMAYADASLRAPCPVGWTTLAGIGWIESGHGTDAGQQLGADGRPLVPILGPLLDGHGKVAAVPDGTGGWARAEGPMQFLPSTWQQWGSDGDGDGVADPQDLDDAAYTAARYLCASGQDLTTGAGWAAAVRSYNHSDAYVLAVYAAATAYAGRSS
jgi:membrane-bound lytic murein transglycosylase B